MFKVKLWGATTELYTPHNLTGHLFYDRVERTDKINAMSKGAPTRVASFLVDKGHRNGDELHIIRSDAVIEIYNRKSRRHITDLIARPGQIDRYYRAVGQTAPEKLISLAREHQVAGLNY